MLLISLFSISTHRWRHGPYWEVAHIVNLVGDITTRYFFYVTSLRTFEVLTITCDNLPCLRRLSPSPSEALSITSDALTWSEWVIWAVRGNIGNLMPCGSVLPRFVGPRE